jgi:hypothetical protein
MNAKPASSKEEAPAAEKPLPRRILTNFKTGGFAAESPMRSEPILVNSVGTVGFFKCPYSLRFAVL